jgi:hypothetical protein
MEWLRKLFSDPRTFAVIATSAVLGLVIGLISGLVKRKHDGWTGFFTAVLTGIAMAVIVGLGTADYIPSETMRLCIVGAAAAIADDIWAGLRAIGRLIATDPLGTVGRILDAFRPSRPAVPPAPPASE